MILTILHSFVNIFAGGRSDSKVWLFITYAVLTSILYLFVKKRIRQRNPDWKYFGITLGSLYLYGLFLHILYTHKIGVKVTDFIITGNNGEISSSTLWHTHVAKVFIGNILALFGYTNLSTIDAGGAYLGLIPNVLIYIGSILLVVVLLQSVIYFCSSFQKFLINRSKRQKLFLIFGYITFSFSLIKTSIDGGIFNQGFYIGFIFILLFYIQLKGSDIKKYLYICLLISIVLLSIGIFVDFLTPSNGLVFEQIASLILLYTIIIYLIGKNIRLQLLIPITGLFLASWWVGASRDFDIYSYSKQVVQKDQYFYVYDKNTNQVVIDKNPEDISISDLNKKHEDNLSYQPITVQWGTCIPSSTFNMLSLDLLTKGQILPNSIEKTEYVYTDYGQSIPYGSYYKTPIKIYTHPCLPEKLTVIDGLFKKASIGTYVIVNTKFYDESDNL